MSKFKEPVDSYRVDGHTHCIADEMIDQNIKDQSHKDYEPCGSSDALSHYVSEFEDGSESYSSYCFSCSQSFTQSHLSKSSLAGEFGLDPEDGIIREKKTFERKPKQEPITLLQRKELFELTGGSSDNGWITHSAKGYRKLDDETLQFYGFRIELKKDGKVKAVYFPETKDGNLQGYKSRHDPKGFGWNNIGSTGGMNDLSGQHKFSEGGKYCLITGGEFDMVAAQQMLREYQIQKGQSSYDRYAVVSPTTGEGSAANQCRKHYEWFDKFDVIVIGLDNDDAGEQAAEKLAKVLPRDKVRIAKWSGKDPNKMLQDGKEKQFLSNFFGAKDVIDSGVYNATEGMLEDVIEVLTTPRIQLPPFANKLQEMTKGSGLFTRSIYSLIGDTSVGKCESPDTPILMADCSVKLIKDIVVGDFVMGSDGAARKVLGCHSGKDIMYKIEQQDSESYIVNSKHVLALRAGFDTNVKGKSCNSSRRCSVDYKKGQFVNISVEDYLKLPFTAKRSLKGYKGVLTKLGEDSSKLLHPWLLGMWLGDGTSTAPEITQSRLATEVIENIYKVSKSSGYDCVIPPSKDKPNVVVLSLKGGFKAFLRKEGVLGNKHIPVTWKSSRYEDRLALLAGLLDSDGFKHRNGYEIIQKSKVLSEDIVFLAKSLGFKCSIKKILKGCQTGAVGTYYRMFISGKVYLLEPYIQLTYKKFYKNEISDLRANANYPIKVTEVGEGDYVGIELDGNHLYCHADFTVTHNSTFIDNWIFYWMFHLKDHKVGIVSIEATKGEWVAGMLSTYLENNLWWIPRDEIRNYMNTPEVKEKINHFFYNEYGESRFAIVDDREGTVASLQKCMERLDRQYGCTIIVNDVLTDILRVEDNEAQARHFNWQSNFVKGGATIFNILHTRKPTDNRGGKPTFPDEFDAYGNSIFVQKAAGNFVIGRNKQAPNGDTIEQNTTYLRVPKLRKGLTGSGGAWYYDGDTRQVYDRDQYFKDNPHKLPDGYDLSVSSFDKAYWEEGGRGWDGVSNTKGGFTKKSSKLNTTVKDIMDEVAL